MKVLLSFVGKQDPLSEKTNEEGAVVTLCRHLRPEAVYLFPSARALGVKSSTEEEAEMTREWLKEILPEANCFVRPLALTDPTDFAQLLPAVKEAVAGVLQELSLLPPPHEIYLNCSSGTSQMQACWYVLANAGYLPGAELWQARNPQDMLPTQARVQRIEVTFMEEENILARIRRSLPGYWFQSIAQECAHLAEISLYAGRRALAEMLARAFTAYGCWDLLQYREAYDRLAALARRWQNTTDAGAAARILEAQAAYLKQLAGEESRETPANLVDLYFNAGRCLERQAYTDTVARFWRLYEGVLYLRLREKWGIEPTTLETSRDRGNLQSLENWLAARGGPGVRRLDLAKADKALQEALNDRGFQQAINQSIKAQRANSWEETRLAALLEELRQKRNLSMVAHGMKPVGAEDAANALRAAAILLQELVPGAAELMRDCPLGREQLEEIAGLLAR